MATPAENQPQVESARVEKRVHGPVAPHELFAFKLMHYLGPQIVQDLDPQGTTYRDFAPNVDIAGFQYPKKQRLPYGVTGITRLINPKLMSPASWLRLKPSDQAETERRLNEIMYRHIAQLANYDEASIQQLLAKSTLNLSELLGFGVEMKHGSFFQLLFLLEAKLAAENKDKHGKDTITSAAGIYELFSKIKLTKPEDGTNTDPYQHVVNSLLAGASQYIKDVGTHGGYYLGAELDPSIDPVQIQASARQLGDLLNSEHGWSDLLPDNAAAEHFDQVKKASTTFTSTLKGPSRCANSPNVRIVSDQTARDANPKLPFRFTAQEPTFTSDRDGLSQITVRVFNKAHTHYLDTTLVDPRILSAEKLQSLVNQQPGGIDQGWKSIAGLESDTMRPVFALSITDKNQTPPGLTDNYGCLGKSLVHLDFRVGREEMDLITHFAHVRIDGAHAADYKRIIESVVPAIPVDNSPFVMERTRVYNPGEIQDRHDLLTALGFSNLVVGDRFDNQALLEATKLINAHLDAGRSQRVVDYIKDQLHDPAKVAQLIQMFSDDYPELRSRIENQRHVLTPLPAPTNEIEVMADLLVNIEKGDPNTEQIITKSANLLRDLFAPRLSPIHLIDYVLATRGGVVNCTLPLATHSRLDTAMVKGNKEAMTTIDQFAQLNTIEAKRAFLALPDNQAMVAQIMTDLMISLDDQTKTRLGVGTAGVFLKKAGGAAEQVAYLASIFTPEIVYFSRNTYAQTSALPGLGKFVTAGSATMPEQNLSIGITDDGKGTGMITFLINLAKPESQDFYLNMLKPIQAFAHFISQAQKNGPLSSGFVMNVRVSTKALAVIPLLTITASDEQGGITLANKLETLSHTDLSEDQKQGIRELMVQAIQFDIKQTVGRTYTLTEMLKLYTELKTPQTPA